MGAKSEEVEKMALVRWDPARELDTLQSDVNRLFDSFFGRREGAALGSQRWVPAMDLVETDDSLVLKADLPGLGKDDVAIEVKDGVLTISGERKAEHETKREGYHRVERSFGRFSRSLGLPRGVDPNAVKASFDRGVLEVTLPKPEESRPTKIEIGGEGSAPRTIEAEARDAESPGAESNDAVGAAH
jgi:HSP20 family protein